MAGRGYLVVTVVAVHVECGRCGDRQRIEQTHADSFTQQVLAPLGSWWVAHFDPRMVAVEVLADGEHQEWKAAS
jgi:hypothetical protein